MIYFENLGTNQRITRDLDEMGLDWRTDWLELRWEKKEKKVIYPKISGCRR